MVHKPLIGTRWDCVYTKDNRASHIYGSKKWGQNVLRERIER